MAINSFTFAHDWKDEAYFPTYEGSPEKVRDDLNSMHFELRNYINNTIVNAINSILSDIEHLVSGTVTDDSVYTAAIQSNAVTSDKLSTTASLTGAAVLRDAIADGAISLAKMGSNSVDTAQIVDGAVSLDKMGNDAVDTLQIVAGAVTNAKLGTDILPSKVGFVFGTGDPSVDPSLLQNGQVYLKLES